MRTKRNNVKQQLIEMVQREMQEKDISLSDLAKKCSINKSYMYKILSGEREPKPATLNRMADVFGYEITVGLRRKQKQIQER